MSFSPSSSGASLRPPASVATVLSSFQRPPSSTDSSIFMPAAGMPPAVSSTCVVRRPISVRSEHLVEAAARDMADLLERVADLGVATVRLAALELRDHARARGHALARPRAGGTG